MFRLPRRLAQPLTNRIKIVNDIYDELNSMFGGIQLDVGAHPGVYDREFWSIDRLHPSELGHRTLAHEFSALLEQNGLTFEPPALELDGDPTTALGQLRLLANEGLPWLARRIRDLGPSACRNARARVIESIRRLGE